MKIQRLYEEAYKSNWGLRKLNMALRYGIPFNIPHKLKITELEKGRIKVSAPYIRKNLNHLKGMHACCLATLAEFSTGVVMLGILEADQYRIIMESIEIKYHYQGKSECVASFEIDEATVENAIRVPVKKEGVVYHRCEVPVHDKEGNLICTGFINWQIKDWTKVRTKV